MTESQTSVWPGPAPSAAAAELVADPLGQLDPAVPAADELRAPFVEQLREPVAGAERQAAERVSVRVDRPAVGVSELGAKAGQRVVHGSILRCVLCGTN